MSVSAKQRARVLEEHGSSCFYCGLSLPTDCLDIDHFIPGDDLILVPACTGCNRSKGDKMPLEMEGDDGPYLTREFLDWQRGRAGRAAA